MGSFQKCTDVHFYLFVPIGIYCGMISYDGRVSFTVNADSSTQTQPAVITRIWGEEFDKLYEEVSQRSRARGWEEKRTSESPGEEDKRAGGRGSGAAPRQTSALGFRAQGFQIRVETSAFRV